MGIFLFIVALLLVIMIHEAGHFLAAKALGFKAPMFFVGFGPTLWSFKRGETEYGIKAIPAGGFVKIVGMNPYEELAPEDESRAYFNKPRWQRALVILAGPATHWPLAFLVLVISFMTIGVPTGDPSNEVRGVEAEIEGAESPAAAAGLQSGDVIVAIDGEETSDWDDVRAYIRDHPSDQAVFTVERDGETKDLDVTVGQGIVGPDNRLLDYAPPGEEIREATGDEQLVGFLGVSPDFARERMGFTTAVSESGGLVVDTTARSWTGLTEFFSGIGNGEFFSAISEGDRPEGTGIVGAGRAANETITTGNADLFVQLMVGLTIFIGMINLVPLVPLDGGHLAVILWETVTRKRVDMRRLIPVAAAVLVFFVLLSLVFLYYDIFQPLELPL